MSFDLTEKIYFTKSKNSTDYCYRNYFFDFNDELVPHNLREALMSQDSEPIDLPNSAPSQILIYRNNIVNTSSSIELINSNDRQADFITELHSITRHDSEDVMNDRDIGMVQNAIAEVSDDTRQNDDEPEMWFSTRTCPNGCNCGKCPMDKGMNDVYSNMSLVPSNSSTSMTLVPSNSNFFISITDVVPLRNNLGAIIHWSLLHYHGISGYNVQLDGNHVASVYSPTRTVAFIDNVNMRFPHHFAVSIIRNTSVREAFQQHSMQAIYFYDPNNSIH